jgi:hypothetical protein
VPQSPSRSHCDATGFGSPPAEAATTDWSRRAVDLGLFAVVSAYVLSALIGLPLFQDGGWYFFALATGGGPEIPNLRFAAVLPQLPAVLAAPHLDDPLLLRHLFSLSYVALPAGSLLACWLLVRPKAPTLVLFPLLWFLLNLLNFSGVSELLSSLYVSWPLALAMLIAPDRRWVRVFAAVAAVILALLHPLAFLPAFALAMLAAALAWTLPRLRRVWGRLALLLLATGLFRLAWTVLGANSYERGRLQGDSALNYLMPATMAQDLLMAIVLMLAIALAAGMLLRGKRPRQWLIGAVPWLAGLIPLMVVLVGDQFLNGVGIQLKSGLSFAAGLALIGLTSLVVLLPRLTNRGGARPPEVPLDGWTRIAGFATASMVALLLMKSSAWWTATRGLQNLLAESEVACIHMSAEQPFALQWPWMRILDDWVTPMNALAFRPRLILAPERGVEPSPLILHGEGCELVHATGKVAPTDWIERDLHVVDERFGPLREQR